MLDTNIQETQQRIRVRKYLHRKWSVLDTRPNRMVRTTVSSRSRSGGTTFTAPTIREKLGNLTILGHDWGRAHSLKIFYNFYYDSKILYTRRLAHYAHAASDGLPTQ